MSPVSLNLFNKINRNMFTYNHNTYQNMYQMAKMPVRYYVMLLMTISCIRGKITRISKIKFSFNNQLN